MTLTVADIATRVKRAFGDEAGSQIDDADIIRWVNDAQNEIVTDNNLLQTKAGTNVVASQADYALPADLLHLRSIRYSLQPLQALTQEDADNFYLGTDSTTTGEPIAFWMFGSNITLYPTPSASVASGLTIYYNKRPTLITTTGQTPELPAQYHNRIVEYCLAQAYELDADVEKAQFKMAQFEAGVGKLKGTGEWETRDVYPSISYIPWDEVD